MILSSTVPLDTALNGSPSNGSPSNGSSSHVSPSLGAYLHRLRIARKFTQVHLARQAAVSAKTVRRWEAGTHKPRLPELDAVLSILGATEPERTQALLLLGAPRASRYFYDLSQKQPLGSSFPSGGDLLRALRHRRRLPLEAVAASLGISPATLSRWESGKVVPNQELLPRLFQTLGARPEEQAALSGGLSGNLFLDASLGPVDSVVMLQERFSQFMSEVSNCDTNALRDLHFLTFEAQAWRLAQSSDAGHRLLAEIYACHTTHLATFGRYAEIAHYAHRAIDLSPVNQKPSNTLLRAIISLAEASVYGRGKTTPRPMKGIEILASWDEEVQAMVGTDPAFVAWMLADKAQYLSQAGYTDAALALGERACRIAENAHENEQRLRQRDRARLLLDAGRGEEALSLVTLHDNEGPFWRTQVYLLRAEGLLLVQEKAAAQEWLSRATWDIRTHELYHLQDRADNIARRF